MTCVLIYILLPAVWRIVTLLLQLSSFRAYTETHTHTHTHTSFFLYLMPSVRHDTAFVTAIGGLTCASSLYASVVMNLHAHTGH